MRELVFSFSDGEPEVLAVVTPGELVEIIDAVRQSVRPGVLHPALPIATPRRSAKSFSHLASPRDSLPGIGKIREEGLYLKIG